MTISTAEADEGVHARVGCTPKGVLYNYTTATAGTEHTKTHCDQKPKSPLHATISLLDIPK